MPGCNVYLLVGQEGLTLIDSGLPWGAPRVLEGIRALGFQPLALRVILVTHGHPDHYGGAGDLQQQTGAKVYMHRADTVPTARGDTVPRYFPIPGYPRPVVDGFLEEGQVLPILGGLRVLHTPGHTPGSICLLLEMHGLLFTGDTLLTTRSRFARPLPIHDPEAYMRSLERLAGLSFEKACPGHGRPLLEGADERLRGLVEAVKARGGPAWWRLLRWLVGLTGARSDTRHR
ncbi:putative metallo-hydrolase YflN [bacterium HR23]|nr:putative metallo-hydrolase YflN [bacterium HR23]